MQIVSLVFQLDMESREWKKTREGEDSPFWLFRNSNEEGEKLDEEELRQEEGRETWEVGKRGCFWLCEIGNKHNEEDSLARDLLSGFDLRFVNILYCS